MDFIKQRVVGSCMLFYPFVILRKCDISLTPTGGSVTPQAQAVAQRKRACPPPCLAPPVSEPPLSPLQRWTPRPSSKLCSSPLHSPPPPLSPPAHRPRPFASRYRSCLVWIHCLFINVLLHSRCSHTNCVFHLDSRPPAFSLYETDFYTFDIHDFSERETHGYTTSCFWFCGIQMSLVCSWDGPLEGSVMWFVDLIQCGEGCQIKLDV